jgi:polyhydroxyalkanoate synthesis regulator phasin
MNDDIPRLEQSKFAEKARPWASAAVLITAATLGWAVAEGVARFADSVRVQLGNSATCCESFRAYRLEDSAQREFWVDVIQQLRQDDHKFSERLSNLHTTVAVLSARMDAARIGNTESDERKWRDEVDQLKRQIEQLTEKGQ